LKWRTGFCVAATGLMTWGTGTRAQDAAPGLAPSLAHSIEDASGRKVVSTVTGDEGVFPTTAEGLAKLRPALIEILINRFAGWLIRTGSTVLPDPPA